MCVYYNVIYIQYRTYPRRGRWRCCRGPRWRASRPTPYCCARETCRLSLSLSLSLRSLSLILPSSIAMYSSVPDPALLRD